VQKRKEERMKAMSMPLDSFDKNNHKRPKWINNHLKKKKLMMIVCVIKYDASTMKSWWHL